MITKGGHAIMLQVSIPDALRDLVAAWCAQRPDARKPSPEYHCTLIFVGRNLGSGTHAAIDTAGEAAYRYLNNHRGRVLFGFGAPTRMGANDHLVEKVIPEPLAELRRDMQGLLPFAQSGYGYKPHVTLATGETSFPYPTDRWPASLFPILGVVVKKGSDSSTTYPLL